MDFKEYKNSTYWMKERENLVQVTPGDIFSILLSYVLFPVGMVFAAILEA